MAKQSAEDRARRLSEGCCPVHSKESEEAPTFRAVRNRVIEIETWFKGVYTLNQ